MATVTKKRSSRRNSPTMSDRLDIITEKINSNHVETIERLAILETQFKGLPERVATLEAFDNKASGGWLTFDKIFTGACAIFTAIVAYLGFKHS